MRNYLTASPVYEVYSNNKKLGLVQKLPNKD